MFEAVLHGSHIRIANENAVQKTVDEEECDKALGERHEKVTSSYSQNRDENFDLIGEVEERKIANWHAHIQHNDGDYYDQHKLGDADVLIS